jgi:hypothetical protein
MHTISKHYASTTHPIPPEFEKWLESIPAFNRTLVAIAILDQCKPVFSNIPRNHLTVVQLPQIEDSAS